MSDEEFLRSQLRLFLSVDVSGSTRLKGKVNYSVLLERLRKEEIGAQEDVSRENFDWEQVQMALFNEFHADFVSDLPQDLAWHEQSPWKALGDELIYSFEVRSMDMLSRLISQFLRTLRKHDSKDGAVLRLTGAAWIAGFPVRNRVVSLPMPHLVTTDESQKFPYPRHDYWGPDIDIGFRIGKHSHAGMCVASISLVELCSREEDPRKQVRFNHVGWAKLKGVFDDIPYPIFWVSFPAAIGGPDAKLAPWAAGESPYVEKWMSCPATSAIAHQPLFDSIRKALDPRFLPEKPYIPGVHDVPDDDKRIVEYLKSLSKGSAGEQDVGDPIAELPAMPDVDQILGATPAQDRTNEQPLACAVSDE